MNENLEPNKSDSNQNERIEDILSSEKWKDTCKKAAQLIENAPAIKRLKQDYPISVIQGGLGVVISLVLIDQNTPANALLFKCGLTGQVDADEALMHTVTAFEDGLLQGKIVERKRMVDSLMSTTL